MALEPYGACLIFAFMRFSSSYISSWMRIDILILDLNEDVPRKLDRCIAIFQTVSLRLSSSSEYGFPFSIHQDKFQAGRKSISLEFDSGCPVRKQDGTSDCATSEFACSISERSFTLRFPCPWVRFARRINKAESRRGLDLSLLVLFF